MEACGESLSTGLAPFEQVVLRKLVEIVGKSADFYFKKPDYYYLSVIIISNKYIITDFAEDCMFLPDPLSLRGLHRKKQKTFCNELSYSLGKILRGFTRSLQKSG